jgi:hypothetical protein
MVVAPESLSKLNAEELRSVVNELLQPPRRLDGGPADMLPLRFDAGAQGQPVDYDAHCVWYLCGPG